MVGFVTNGYFIDGTAMDGLRACLTDEFHQSTSSTCAGTKDERRSSTGRKAEKSSALAPARPWPSRCW